LGWYGGAGARLISQGGPGSVGPQAACPGEQGTGLVRCSWTTTFTLALDSQGVSGLYALKLLGPGGETPVIPLGGIDERRADLLFQASVQTYQAYNAWGGESLYSDTAKATKYGYATKVSFDRPFDSGHGLGQMLNWETPMARFLERNGYDVTYASNPDVALEGGLFLWRAGTSHAVCHDE